MAVSKVGGGTFNNITDVLSGMDKEIMALAEQISTKTGQKVEPDEVLAKLGLEGPPGSFWKTDSEDEDSTKTSGVVDEDWGAIAHRVSARTGQNFTAQDLLARFGNEGGGALAEVERRSGRTAMRNDLEAQMKALRMRGR